MKTRNYQMLCVIGLMVFFGLLASGLQAAEKPARRKNPTRTKYSFWR